MGVIKNMLSTLVDSLFVDYKCIFCNTETINDSRVCSTCEEKLKIILSSICDKCGALIDKSDVVCAYCFDKKYVFSKHRSCFIYSELSSTPVKLLKYEKKKYLAKSLAKIMFALNKDIFHNVDIITFVPMTTERKRNRGYNQSEEICKVLSDITKIPVKPLLIKNHSTSHQADLNFIDRTKNLKGSFAINDKYIELLKGKRVLIVDDVFTTGSTLNECSRVLLKSKAKEVRALTFLKTDPFDNSEDTLIF